MIESAAETPWRFVKIGLVVTGEGEKEFLADFFKPIAATGHAAFEAIFKVGQRAAMAQKRIDEYGKQGKDIPGKDESVALVVRRYVAQQNRYAVWIDDLESGRRKTASAEYDRLIRALDRIIGHQPELRMRCSVHFLVNMLEAYYFADISSVNCAFSTELANHAGDCENIRHPKNELKRLVKIVGRSFNEKGHGALIVSQLNLETILANPDYCRALRTLVAWCWEAVGEPRTEKFCLTNGVYWDITAGQLSQRPNAEQVGPLGDERSYLPS